MGEYVGYLEVARRKCARVGNCEPPAALTPSSAVLIHGDAVIQLASVIGCIEGRVGWLNVDRLLGLSKQQCHTIALANSQIFFAILLSHTEYWR